MAKKTKTPTLAEVVLENFGSSYAKWTSDELKNYFGEDVIKLLLEISDPKGQWDTNSTEGRLAIQRAFKATNYFISRSSAIQNWDKKSDADKTESIEKTKRSLASKYGDLQFNDATLTDLATKILRSALDPIAQEQLIFGTAYEKTPTVVAGGEDAAKLRTIAKKFGFNPIDLDDQIKSILTGKVYAPTGTVITEDSFRQNAKTSALAVYPHLKTQFDAGLTLDDIFSPYRSIIAKTLEKTENEIDISDPDFSRFLGNSQKGQMALGDVLETIRTNPKYGFQFTRQANQEATNIGLAIARAFGKVQ